MTVEGLEIDLGKRVVHRDGERVDLTKREYDLLTLLTQNVGETVSRRQIHARLYRDHPGVPSNVVSVYIGYLRRKLNARGAQNLIHTRRGVGFVLAGRDYQ